MIFILPDMFVWTHWHTASLNSEAFFYLFIHLRNISIMSRRMSAAVDLTPPCYLPAFGSAAFRRQPHSAHPQRLNLMMIGQMTGTRGLSTAGSPRAAISLLCPTTTAAASHFPPGGSLRKVATTRPSITTHSRQSLSV